MKHLAVESHSSVAEYFHEALSEALRNQGVEASAHAEFYLVNLLSEYSHAALPDEPITFLLAEANQAEPPLRLKKLRTVGDLSLYITGFFADSLQARLIDSKYYIDVGGSAYASLARSCTTPPWPDTYKELAGKFAQLVEVLAEVAVQRNQHSDADVVRLYERYLRTRSGWLLRRLLGMGVGVPSGGGPGGGASA